MIGGLDLAKFGKLGLTGAQLVRFQQDPGVAAQQILGWICAFPAQETLVLHYAYVKHPFRGHGIARMLFRHVRSLYPDGVVTFTHKSPIFWKWEKDREPFFKKVQEWGFVYHPYLLFMSVPEEAA